MKTNNKKLLNAVVILLVFYASGAFSQTAANLNQFGIAYSSGDAFNFSGNTVSHYGLGWYNELQGAPPLGYFSGFSGLRFFTEGQPRMFLDRSGNLGLGTGNALSRLHIAGGDESITLGEYNSPNIAKGIFFPGFRDVVPNYFGASIEAVPEWLCCGGFPAPNGYPGIRNMGLNFNVHGNADVADSKITALSINSNGNIGIGTVTPKERLSVNGNIRAREIRVETEKWPDYVFLPAYRLPTLLETEKHIKDKGYLPGMPSAKEVEADGIAMGEMFSLQQKKIEELTLYLIEQHKAINIENKKLLEQGKQIRSLRAELNTIKKKK